MKVSLRWIEEYLAFPLPPLAELTNAIGAKLGEIEEITQLAPRYEKVVVVKIIECEALTSSDHLRVCMIDDGGRIEGIERNEKGLVQVVTGAPNVHADMYVAWLPPGSTVPSTYDKDPFVLEARKLRGSLSNGMLASARELAIGDNHEGILELIENDLHPGDSFMEVFQLDDTIITIENKMFTHRPDCFGMLGVAREIAGILGHDFQSPEIYRNHPQTAMPAAFELLNIRNELPDLVPRFMATVFENVSIKPSSLRLQSYLSRVGIRPINNVVDLTNYFMVLTGQPLHAYDYEKVKHLNPAGKVPSIVIRFPRPEEKLSLLNGKEVELRPESIVIATENQAIGLGGIMGGKSTEVDEATKTIILECGTFDMFSIRRTSMGLGIFSDAVTRFNKGQSPLQNDRVLAWISGMFTDEMQAQLAGGLDICNLLSETLARDSLAPAVSVEVDFINSRLGSNMDAAVMAKHLSDVEFQVASSDGSLAVQAPFWRTDIALREDIIEEVGRLEGFDSLPLKLPMRDLAPVAKNPLLELKDKIRGSLAHAGANEILSYSFVHGKLLETVGQNRQQAFRLSNALSPELQYYRLHALPSLLDKVHMNSKAGYRTFALFELNKGHNLLHKDDGGGVPTEIEFLDFVYVDNEAGPVRAFYSARRFLDNLAHDLGLRFSYSVVADDPSVPVAAPYDLARSAYVSAPGGHLLGMVGELKPAVRAKLKLPLSTAAFTIGPSQLREALQQKQWHYRQLPKFPWLEQDICLKVDLTLPYQELYDFIIAELKKIAPEETITDLTPLDIYIRDDDQVHKQITFRLAIASYKKTMTDQEVSKLLDQLAQTAAGQFGATRI